MISIAILIVGKPLSLYDNTKIGPLLCNWDMILLYLIVADMTGGNKEVESVRSIVKAFRLPPRVLQLGPPRVPKIGQLS